MVPITCIICCVPGYLLLLESDRDYAYPGLVPREQGEAVGPCGTYGCRTGHDELLVRIFVDSSLWPNYLSGEMVSNCLLMSYGVVKKIQSVDVKAITTILNHLTRGYTPSIVDNEVKIPEQYFQGKEAKQDKRKTNKRRKNNMQNLKLSYRTIILQFHGFTCGLDDLMVSTDCDKEIQMELEGGYVGTRELQLETEKIIRSNCVTTTACLDSLMQTEQRGKGSKFLQCKVEPEE
ncbi:hypothetical protein L6452_08268 [Arctium lappa]|uniref:Uncharacterized protein n=1 Tax=Arctium lappa TaxID=4217 RepID=A0ACB9DHU3_ARCLA|nr:hypothetical protein L6452_08268 [Arctium lappa]